MNDELTQTEMTDEEWQQLQASTMTEKQLQAVIVASARRWGWLVYHTKVSIGSSPGYPDLHLVHPVQGISMLRELKTQKGKLTEPQRTWLNALQKAGVDVDVWRPEHWFNHTIQDLLFEASF